MMSEPSLDGVRMSVTSTDPLGVVNGETVLSCRQFGARVIARYSGGRLRRGCLVGRRVGDRLMFRFAQVDLEGRVDAGRSRCRISRTDRGVRIHEHFRWTTRTGSGTNLIDQLAG